MSQQPNPSGTEPAGNGAPPVTPVSGVDDGERRRLGPRPLLRPQVDPGQAATFGRPPGVSGAFAARLPQAPERNGVQLSPPPPAALVSAFGRPPGQDQVVLQRPPGDVAESGQDSGVEVEPVFWTGQNGDPWRDPASGAVIGPPALHQEPEPAAPEPTKPGPLLSLPEVLFGRRVKPTALVLLAVVALLVGAAGGLVGWGISRAGNPLTSDVTLAQVTAGKERPAGSVADLARKVAPAVVSIELKGNQISGVGSGVVIDGGGYILTNDHVVAETAKDPSVKMTAVFTDGTRANAAVVGRDPKTDLAVVKVAVSNPTVAQLGDSDKLQVGDTVIAIGSPLGLADTVTSGIVSALHRPVTAGGDNGDPAVTYDAIQTDAAINHGNSGGALVDSTGALVGINSSIQSSSAEGGSIGLGFAIPVNDAKRIAEQLIKTGKVNHADLGLNAKSVSAETAEGAQVQNVVDGGAAAQAGIVEGDVITKVGDRAVRNAPELVVAVRQHNIGDTVTIQLARQGRQLELKATLKSD